MREGSESVHAFDRCEGFKVSRDESRSSKRASLEKGISGEPFTSFHISTSKELKSGTYYIKLISGHLPKNNKTTFLLLSKFY